MANLTPIPGLDPIPEFAVDTVARGGPGGPMNMQAQALLNSIDWMRKQFVNAADPRFAGGAKGDGVTDCAPAIQAAHDYAKANYESAMVFLPPPAHSYKVNSGFVWDTNCVGLIGSGVMDASGLSNGDVLFRFIQSYGDVNRRPARNRMHPLSGMLYMGPGVENTAKLCVIADSVNYVIAGITFRDGGASNWSVGFEYGDGAFFTTIENFDFSAYSGTSMGVCADIQSAANAGERNVFKNVRFGSAAVGIRQEQGSASTFLDFCSFNYLPRMITQKAGSIFMSGGHIEGKSDTDNWVHQTGQDSLFTARGFELIIADRKDLKEIFYCSDEVKAGIHLNEYRFGCTSELNVDLIGGRGRSSSKGLHPYFNGTQPSIGWGCNRLAYGDFAAENSLSEWTTFGPTPPQRSSNNPSPSGGFNMLITGAPGQSNGASVALPCGPGAVFTGSFMASVTGRDVGGTLYVAMAFKDKAGAYLGGTFSILEATENFGWRRHGIALQKFGPPGTVSVEFSVSVFGVSTGNPLCRLDDIKLNISE